MKRLLHLVVIAVLLASLPLVAEESYGRLDAMVEMSDGVNLDASLYIPAGDGPFPLIVRQHGGGSNKDSSYDLQYGLRGVEDGNFALLTYSHRGHGNSEGLFDFFGPRTTTDASEMIDWVATAAPRVDTDNVGMSGYSQGGASSLMPAGADPRVKAVAVGNTFASLNHALNPNDCFKLSFATGIFAAAYKASASRTDDAKALRWGATLYSDTEDVSTPLVPSTTDDMEAHSPTAYLGGLVERKVPVFWTQSWEDHLFPGDHPEIILDPLQQAGAPVHRWFASGGHSAGPNWMPDEQAKEQAILDWFEQHLLGIDHGFGTTRDPVDYWRRDTHGRYGSGTWIHRTASAWPVPETSAVTLYAPELTAQYPSTAVGTVVNGLVAANLAYDPIVAGELASRAPGMGDVVAMVPEDPNPLNTVRFARTLDEPLEFVGTPRLVVPYSSTSMPVEQLSAKLWDVGPEGAMLISRGCLSRASGPNDDSPEMHFPLWPTAHRFQAGHQLVLTISASDLPTFKPDTFPAITALLAGTRLVLPVLD